jgi:hypothetical protein
MSSITNPEARETNLLQASNDSDAYKQARDSQETIYSLVGGKVYCGAPSLNVAFRLSSGTSLISFIL